MNVLVVGQGGREHALIRALRHSPSIGHVHALPGSDGMASEATCHSMDWRDFDAVGDLIHREKIDFVIIGPEIPLAGGLSDALRERGVAVVGPSREAARLESSKIYSKEFMVEAGVPTARYKVVSSLDDVSNAAKEFGPPYVLKADGLAAGKGVYICRSEAELERAARSLFEEDVLGDAGRRALLEEFQSGYEISYLILTNGEEFSPLVLAQDHKRLLDGDEGPNTGGMGVVAPVGMDQDLRSEIDENVIRPVLRLMKKRGLLYRGILYVGLMMTPSGARVLEFNVRFGDPEAQVILPLMGSDWGEVFKDLSLGRMPALKWKSEAAACVVLAAAGYPDHPVHGSEISGLEKAPLSDVRYFLHAGTRKDPGRGWVTAGGRVLNAIGLGRTLKEAVDNAYLQAGEVGWDGIQIRRDIGSKVLN